MNSKAKYLIISLALLAAFAVGRFTVSKETSTTTFIDEAKQVAKDTHVQTETTTVKLPDGTVKTVTTTDTVSSLRSEKNKTTELKTETKVTSGKLNVSVIAAYDFKDKKEVVYGVSVTKNIIGPITAGAFGLTNGTAGLSLGLDF